MKLYDSVQFIKGVGEKRAELFSNLGVSCVGALLRYYPRDYRDKTHPLKLCEVPFDRPCCIKATVLTEVQEIITRSRMAIYRFLASDGDEEVAVTIFNNRYLANSIETGKTYLFYGKVDRNLVECSLESPEVYPENDTELSPIYRLTSGLTNKYIGKIVKTALESTEISETLPEKILDEYKLIGLKDAITGIHFPHNKGVLEAARKRLVFEELFFLQLGLLCKKGRRKSETKVTVSDRFFGEFEALLPFTLTDGQRSAVITCLKDMRSGTPMSRLLQGDVGSGKTAVAAALSHSAVKSGYTVMIMAPTEVLATQHFTTFSKLFDGTDITVALLTGQNTAAQKRKIKQAANSGETDILIGTHALIEDDVKIRNLGLVITDEQHRFGVEQRTRLAHKGNEPHILVMSATPIPRTMSLIFYGDLDISVIPAPPKNRIPVETYLIDGEKRVRAYNYIKKHIKEGRQAYIVCPMVEENESVDLASATELYEKLSNEDFKDFKVGLLHGKMKPKEKDEIMARFAAGEIDLLVSTTVIEVGVDVPNSVIMMIENAERFGLSQLHQLRGRIGRGNYRSTCILVSDAKGGDALTRLKFVTQTADGFKIADEDLKLRGPGDFLGKRQHGLPDLKIADLSEDIELFKAAGAAARTLYAEDPSLSLPQNSRLKKEVIKIFKEAEKFGNN